MSEAETSRTPNLAALRQAVLWPAGLILVVRSVGLVGYVKLFVTGDTIQRANDPFLAISAINKVLQGAGVAFHTAFLVLLAGASLFWLWRLVLPLRERALLCGVLSICVCEAFAVLVCSFWFSSAALLGLYILDVCLCLGVILTATLGICPNADSSDNEE
ncbi:MAG: hypothetical protein WC655_04495 [Candidatus Hydrogenedentales bacterium]